MRYYVVSEVRPYEEGADISVYYSDVDSAIVERVFDLVHLGLEVCFETGPIPPSMAVKIPFAEWLREAREQRLESLAKARIDFDERKQQAETFGRVWNFRHVDNERDLAEIAEIDALLGRFST